MTPLAGRLRSQVRQQSAGSADTGSRAQPSPTPSPRYAGKSGASRVSSPHGPQATPRNSVRRCATASHTRSVTPRERPKSSFGFGPKRAARGECSLSPLGARLKHAASCGLSREDQLPWAPSCSRENAPPHPGTVHLDVCGPRHFRRPQAPCGPAGRCGRGRPPSAQQQPLRKNLSSPYFMVEYT
jgi:hypothetical protein